MSRNYRNDIKALCDEAAFPGEDWSSAVLAGSPDLIDANTALGIANWLDGDADGEWEPDMRHYYVARCIRRYVAMDRVEALGLDPKTYVADERLFGECSQDEHLEFLLTTTDANLLKWAAEWAGQLEGKGDV